MFGSSQFSLLLSCLKKLLQSRLKNNHLTMLIWIRDTLCTSLESKTLLASHIQTLILGIFGWTENFAKRLLSRKFFDVYWYRFFPIQIFSPIYLNRCESNTHSSFFSLLQEPLATHFPSQLFHPKYMFGWFLSNICWSI